MADESLKIEDNWQVNRWLISIVVFCCSTVAMAVATDLPRFTLQDSMGKIYDSAKIGKYGLVLVVTAPILSNESAQKGWNKYLPQARADTRAQLFFIEDMAPSKFKETALSKMKHDYNPAGNPFLLIDPAGDVRKALGVAPKQTMVLVYNAKGKLVMKESGNPSMESAQRIWQSLRTDSSTP